jgi:TolB-like protein
MRGEPSDPNKTLVLETILVKYAGGLGSAMGFAEMVGSGDAVEGTGVTLFVRFRDKKLDTELGTIKVSRGGMSKDTNLDKASKALVESIRQKEYDEDGKRPVQIPVHYSGGSSGSRTGGGALIVAPGSNIAVLAFSTNGASDMEATVAADLIRNEIVNLGTNFYNVIDRQYVNKVMGEHAFAATGITSAEGAAAIGRMMNAQKVVTGTLTKMMDTYFVSANLIDVETGKIESAASGDYKTADDMKQTAQIVANQLVRLK